MPRLADQLACLVGETIRLERGGPDELRGTLVHIGQDYVSVALDSGNIVHVPLHHPKSLTTSRRLTGAEVARPLIGAEAAGSASALEPVAAPSGPIPSAAPTATGVSFPGTFRQLLEYLRGERVQVYQHGPECLTGTLEACGDDYITLLARDDELVHYPTFHLRSVRRVPAVPDSSPAGALPLAGPLLLPHETPPRRRRHHSRYRRSRRRRARR